MADKKAAVVRERLQTLLEEARFTREQLVVLCVLAIFALSGGLLAARQARIVPVARQTFTTERENADSRRRGTDSARQRRSKPKIKAPVHYLVHVAGEVVNPGLYQVPRGARVADAVKAAGGPLDSAALDHLNLAAKVLDGQKVAVGKAAAEPTGGAVPEASEATVNINEADLAGLETLDGVGPVLAKRILDWRERHGGFTSLSQLNEVSGIGPKKYARLKEQARVN